MDQSTTTTYEAPRLVVLGRVEDVTAGGQNGFCIDDTFVTGTHFNDLTFSVCS